MKKQRMSKRMGTRKREKINKKVKEHNRKLRKEKVKRRKIPSNVMITKEWKDHLEQIKIKEELRNSKQI